MASLPRLNFDMLTTFASDGGYSQHVRMTEQTNVILLSLVAFCSYRYFWQTRLQPISDSEYEQIEQALADASEQLMSNFAIGTIFPSITDDYDSDVLLLNGQVVNQSDYPALTSTVPASWLVGSTIQLPDMTGAFLQGNDTPAEIGTFDGDNEISLTVDEMPEHTHVQNPHDHSYSSTIITTALGGEIPATASLVTPSLANTSPTTATNQNAGNGQPHSNVPLSLQIYWFIIAR